MAPVKLAYDVVYPDGDVQRNLPPVILLHGMMDSRKTWSALAPKIAKGTGRIVYAYDARNHGESGWSNEFNFDILASDLERFMDDVNISKAVLIGHSMGGRTALTLALKAPQRVEKLIVEDMGAKNWNAIPGSMNVLVYLLTILKESVNSIPQGASYQEAQKAVVDFVINAVPQLRGSKNATTSFDPSTIALKQTETGGYAFQANMDVVEDVLVNMDKLKQILSGVYLGDALFLYGTKSFFKVDKDNVIPQLFPNAQKVPFERAGHLLHIEFPQKFLQHVIYFIESPQKLQSKC